MLENQQEGKGKPFGAANTANFCLLVVLTTLETTKNGISLKSRSNPNFTTIIVKEKRMHQKLNYDTPPLERKKVMRKIFI